MERLNLPLKLGQGKVSVFTLGLQLFLETDFGLKVAFNWGSLLLVTLPRHLYNTSCGLCQGVPLSPPTITTTEWGMAWAERDAFCQVGCRDSCPGCGLGGRSVLHQAAEASVDDGTDGVNAGVRLHFGNGLFVFVDPEAVRLCGFILDREGVFARCHSKVAPAFFYQSCLQDACLDQGAQETVCSWLQMYTGTCQLQGVAIPSWRNSTPCGECGPYPPTLTPNATPNPQPLTLTPDTNPNPACSDLKNH